MFRMTTGRTNQVIAIQTAANTNTSVLDEDYISFIQYTAPMYEPYMQWIAMQPTGPKATVYDPLTIAWLTVVAAPANNTIYAVDTFFKQLRNDGNLLFDYFYLFAQDIQSNARIELFKPGTRTIVEHGAPTFTTNIGYTGNGTSMFLDTGFISSLHAVNYTVDNACFGVYARLLLGDSASYIIGAFDGINAMQLALRYPTNHINAAINTTNTNTALTTTTQGLKVVTKNGSGNLSIYDNGNLIGSHVSAEQTLPTVSDYILCLNDSGTPSSYDGNQVACAFKGSGLINQALLNSAINTLMINLGAHY